MGKIYGDKRKFVFEFFGFLERRLKLLFISSAVNKLGFELWASDFFSLAKLFVNF